MPTPSPITVTYVTATGCHLCDHGRKVLDELGRHVRLQVVDIDLDSEQGRHLLATHRFAFPPAVIVDGTMIAHGRLSARRLAQLLPLAVR